MISVTFDSMSACSAQEYGTFGTDWVCASLLFTPSGNFAARAGETAAKVHANYEMLLHAWRLTLCCMELLLWC